MRAMVGVMAINDASGSGGERNGAMSGAEMVRAMAKAMAKAHLQQTVGFQQTWNLEEPVRNPES